ncbi:MAG: hypothetical protein ACP5JJ_04995, partial [Anaerolineae bacterium]
ERVQPILQAMWETKEVD